jgi:hypothetical protein
MSYLTYVRKYKIVNIDYFLLRIFLALFSGMFREGIGAIFDGIKNDRKHEQEIEFVDKRTSCSTKNRASVFRATLLKHRSVLGHFNPREKLSDI